MEMGYIRVLLALEVLIYHLPSNSYLNYIAMNKIRQKRIQKQI